MSLVWLDDNYIILLQVSDNFPINPYGRMLMRGLSFVLALITLSHVILVAVITKDLSKNTTGVLLLDFVSFHQQELVCHSSTTYSNTNSGRMIEFILFSTQGDQSHRNRLSLSNTETESLPVLYCFQYHHHLCSHLQE